MKVIKFTTVAFTKLYLTWFYTCMYNSTIGQQCYYTCVIVRYTTAMYNTRITVLYMGMPTNV